MQWATRVPCPCSSFQAAATLLRPLVQLTPSALSVIPCHPEIRNPPRLNPRTKKESLQLLHPPTPKRGEGDGGRCELRGGGLTLVAAEVPPPKSWATAQRRSSKFSSAMSEDSAKCSQAVLGRIRGTLKGEPLLNPLLALSNRDLLQRVYIPKGPPNPIPYAAQGCHLGLPRPSSTVLGGGLAVFHAGPRGSSLTV